MRSIFLKKGNPIFFIKLGQRLPKTFSELHVKNSRFFVSYFLKKDDWPKAYAGPRLPTFPNPSGFYETPYNKNKENKYCSHLKYGLFFFSDFCGWGSKFGTTNISKYKNFQF